MVFIVIRCGASSEPVSRICRSVVLNVVMTGSLSLSQRFSAGEQWIPRLGRRSQTLIDWIYHFFLFCFLLQICNKDAGRYLSRRYGLHDFFQDLFFFEIVMFGYLTTLFDVPFNHLNPFTIYSLQCAAVCVIHLSYAFHMSDLEHLKALAQISQALLDLSDAWKNAETITLGRTSFRLLKVNREKTNLYLLFDT